MSGCKLFCSTRRTLAQENLGGQSPAQWCNQARQSLDENTHDIGSCPAAQMLGLVRQERTTVQSRYVVRAVQSGVEYWLVRAGSGQYQWLQVDGSQATVFSYSQVLSLQTLGKLPSSSGVEIIPLDG